MSFHFGAVRISGTRISSGLIRVMFRYSFYSWLDIYNNKYLILQPLFI